MLTPKQRIFIDEYSLDRNASRAARVAGYSAQSAKVTASRLLTNANVLDALHLREIEMQSAFNVTRKVLLNELQGTIALARSQSNPMAMIAALREVAKLCGFYAPEQKEIVVHNKKQRGLGGMEAMSDAELEAIIHSKENGNE